MQPTENQLHSLFLQLIDEVEPIPAAAEALLQRRLELSIYGVAIRDQSGNRIAPDDFYKRPHIDDASLREAKDQRQKEASGD